MRVTILVIVFIISCISSNANLAPIKDSLVKNGVEQLDYLYAYNKKNDRAKNHHKNWYIFYLGSDLGKLKDTIAHYLDIPDNPYIIDQRTTEFIFTDPFVASLNTLLQTINAQADIDYYVGLTSREGQVILQLTPQGASLEDQVNYYKALLKDAKTSDADEIETKKDIAKVEALRTWFQNIIDQIHTASPLGSSAKTHKILTVACEYKRAINQQEMQERFILATRKYTPGLFDGKAYNEVLREQPSSFSTSSAEQALERNVRAFNAYLHTNLDKYKYKFDHREDLGAAHWIISRSNGGTPPSTLPDPESSSIYLFDYIGMYADPVQYNELNSLLAGQRQFQETGSSNGNLRLFWNTQMRLYLTNYKTPHDIKDRISLYEPGGDMVMVWINFEQDGHANIKIKFDPALEKDLKDVLKFEQSSILGKTWIVIKKTGEAVGEAVVTTIYMVCDFLAHVIRDNLTIPRCYWDPENPASEGGYQGPIADVFEETLTVPISLDYLDDILDELGITIPPGSNGIVTYPFAFICGLWNGIVDEVAGIFDGAAMITGALVDESKAHELEVMWQQVKEKGIAQIIKDGVAGAHSGTSHQVVHQVAKDIVFVVSLAAPFAGQLAKIGKLTKIVRVLELANLLDKFNPISYVFTAAGAVVKKVTKVGYLVAAEVRVLNTVIADIYLATIDGVETLVFEARKFLNAGAPGPFIGRIFPSPQVALRAVRTDGSSFGLLPNEYFRVVQSSGETFVERAVIDVAATLEDLVELAAAKLDDAIKKFLPEAADQALFRAELAAILESNGRNIYNLTDDLVEAWDLIRQYSTLRINFSDLQKAAKLLRNTKLAEAGLSKDLLKRMITANGANAGAAAFSLPEMLEGLDHLVTRGTKFDNIENLIIDLEKAGTNFPQGAGWIIHYMSLNVDEFAGRPVIFEALENVVDDVNPNELVRRVDIKMGDGTITKYFEFKSVQVAPPASFSSQFIKDLKLGDVLSLDQLKWYFDGRKISLLNKADFVNAIRNVPELNSQKVFNLFNAYSTRIGQGPILDLNDLLAFMDTNDDWFALIFKIK